MKPSAFFISVIAMGFFSRLFGGAVQERRAASESHEVPRAEALARKKQSIKFLRLKGCPVIEHLPAIEDSVSAKFRSRNEIAERLVACTIAAVAGETGDKKFVDQLLTDFAAAKLLSPKEHEFIERRIDDQKERVQFSWRYERAWVLFWALGYVERLDYPPKICDVPKLAGFLRGKSVEQIAREAKLRSPSAMLDEADLIYRIHWATTEERVNGTVTVPEEIERGVVQERHAALNWLIGYQGQEWDEITTDT